MARKNEKEELEYEEPQERDTQEEITKDQTYNPMVDEQEEYEAKMDYNLYFDNQEDARFYEILSPKKPQSELTNVTTSMDPLGFTNNPSNESTHEFILPSINDEEEGEKYKKRKDQNEEKVISSYYPSKETQLTNRQQNHQSKLDQSSQPSIGPPLQTSIVAKEHDLQITSRKEQNTHDHFHQLNRSQSKSNKFGVRQGNMERNCQLSKLELEIKDK
eukprot:Gb_12659 [translate_table: standard]